MQNITYTATDKKRIYVNGELVREQGGKTVRARAKVVAHKEIALARNADGNLKLDESGRAYYIETGNIVYGVKFSNVSARELLNQNDEMYAGSERLWEQVVELS